MERERRRVRRKSERKSKLERRERGGGRKGRGGKEEKKEILYSGKLSNFELRELVKNMIFAEKTFHRLLVLL